MIKISKKNMGKNDAEVIMFNGKKWLNEKHIETQLKNSNVAAITNKYSLKLRKKRQELQNCGNYQPCRRFLKFFNSDNNGLLSNTSSKF